MAGCECTITLRRGGGVGGEDLVSIELEGVDATRIIGRLADLYPGPTMALTVVATPYATSRGRDEPTQFCCEAEADVKVKERA